MPAGAMASAQHGMVAFSHWCPLVFTLVQHRVMCFISHDKQCDPSQAIFGLVLFLVSRAEPGLASSPGPIFILKLRERKIGPVDGS